MERCLGQPVEVQRHSLPSLIAALPDAALWRQIAQRSAAHKDPARYLRVAVAMRAVLGRRKKTQRWINGDRVFWR